MRSAHVIPPTLLCVGALSLLLAACDSGPPEPPTPVPARIEYVGGNDQVAALGAETRAPLAVRVVTDTGAPVGGVAVTFRVVSGEAELSTPSPTTTADGLAATAVMMGGAVGDVVVHATSGGLAGSPVIFTLTARHAPFPTGILADLGTRVAEIELDRERAVLYASLGDLGEVVAVSLETGQIVRRAQLGAEPVGLALSAAGDRLYVAARGDGTVRVLDPGSLSERRRVYVQTWTDHPWTYGVVEVAPDRIVVAANPQSSAFAHAALVDLSGDRAEGAVIDGGWAIRMNPRLHLSPDGRRLYIVEAAFPSGAVYAITLSASSAPPVTMRSYAPAYGVLDTSESSAVASPSGSRLYYSSGQMADAQTLNVVGLASPGVPAVDHNGRYVYMVAGDRISVYGEAGLQREVTAALRVPRRAAVWSDRAVAFVVSCATLSSFGYGDCDRIYSVNVE